VDAIADHTGRVVIGGIMEHIEQGGIHSGLCPYRNLVTIGSPKQDSTWTVQLAKELNVIGLMNIQFVVVGTQGMTRRFILKPTRASLCLVSKATVCH